MPFRAVLFDLDGTLLDTIGDLADSMNSVLRSHALPEHPVESYKLFVGEGVEALVARALPSGMEYGTDMKSLVDEMKKEYRSRWSARTRPYDGISILLAALADRKIPMSVLSNKPDEFTREMVSYYFPETPFFTVMGARPNVPMKPDPSAALSLCARMGIPPETVLYLGDSGTDMRTAVKAGMFPAGVLWGFRSAEELKENGAKLLINRPEEVLEMF